MEEIRREDEAVQAEQPAGRDYLGEIQDLYAERPELRGGELPEEVVRDCVRGATVREAYGAYLSRKDAEALRRENRALRQNASAASRAPVRGVTRGGSANARPEDAFLRGFHEEW